MRLAFRRLGSRATRRDTIAFWSLMAFVAYLAGFVVLHL